MLCLFNTEIIFLFNPSNMFVIDSFFTRSNKLVSKTETLFNCKIADISYPRWVRGGGGGSTVKPVLSGPLLNGHPLLSGQL